MPGLVAALLLGGCAGAPATDARPTPTRVGPDAFAEAVAEPGTFVLNVHTPDEGRVPGTDASVPFDRLRSRSGELPAERTTPIAVYCRTGRMSAEATRTLTDLGYTDVTELEGGMEGWRRDGRTLLGSSRMLAGAADGASTLGG